MVHTYFEIRLSDCTYLPHFGSRAHQSPLYIVHHNRVQKLQTATTQELASSYES